jgi:hypothetical protein
VGYEAARPTLAGLGEPAGEPLNEAELSWIWAGQRYPPGALQLVDGRSLRVLSPGRPGGGAGPDFLDAVLEIDGERLRGDVELHVRASGFRAHGHDMDAAYDGLALHVVFRADDGPFTRLSGGRQAAVAAFAPWLQGRTEELRGWLAADALWREPCQDAVLRIGEDGTRHALRLAGLRRFEARTAGLRAVAAEAGEAEAVWRGLLDVLGVGGDREGFRRLADAFPERLARGLTGNGSAGEARSRLTRALVHVAGLGAATDIGGLPQPLRPALAAQGRPANRPERRLAGLAGLYVLSGGDLPAFVRRTVTSAETARALVAGWRVSVQGRTLIGEGRARELALNVALPFAAGEGPLRAAAMRLVAEMSAGGAYGKTAFLEANLRGSGGRRVVRTVLEQQGLLGFLGEWCSRGGCGRCPLS